MGKLLKGRGRFAVFAAIIAIVWACQPVALADSFNVVFDDSIECPQCGVVGTGTFSFAQNLGDGTYSLTSLTGYNIDFAIAGTTFTNANISNPDLSAVLVVIHGGGTQFYFDNTGVFGPFGGSLDFGTNFSNGPFLTTEPDYFGPPPLDLYQAKDNQGNFYFGVYQSSTVPEPSSLLLFCAGLLGIGGLVSLRKRLGSGLPQRCP